MNKLIIIVAILLVIGILAFVYIKQNQIPVPKSLIGDEFSMKQIDRSLNYRYFLQEAKNNEKLPLVIYMHGAAERGSDNRSQVNPASLQWIDTDFQKQHPCYVIIPQCPKQRFWVDIKFKSFPMDHYNQDQIPEADELKLLMGLIDDFSKKYNVDTKRIYLVGFSMGSSAVWDLITRHTEKFAASINMAGCSDTAKAAKLANFPIRIFNGKDDDIMPPRLNTEMYNAIKSHGGKDVQLTIFPGVSHDCVGNAYQTLGLFHWLFNQKKE
jgi:predicted peptidase